MAHFAELDENNIVQRVIVVANAELLVDGVESETKGIEFCQSLFGGTWIQTSYNSKIRGKFAGIGDVYDATLDRFIPEQPYPSWSLDKNFIWQPPVAYPSDGNGYDWNESSKSWDEIIPALEAK